MTTIHIKASRLSQCIVEPHILSDTGAYALNVAGSGSQACIITDCNVEPLYAQQVRHSLESHMFEVTMIVLPAGEEAKSFTQYERCIDVLAHHHYAKDDVIVALGGGCVGDLAGFVAATYMRGIHLIQLPTTLLAMVDSSVGGKCAINVSQGKNLVGSIYQPEVVLADPVVLYTLSRHQFADGCAEMIKCGIIEAGELYDMLMCPFEASSEGLMEAISSCIQLKARIVEQDEQDTGVRMLLNLGHSSGHALEKLSGYTISHGHGVACGTLIAAYVAQMHFTEFDQALIDDLKAIFHAYELPVTIKQCIGRDIEVCELMDAIGMDKKIRNHRLCMVLPKAKGDVRVVSISLDELADCMRTIIDAKLV